MEIKNLIGVKTRRELRSQLEENSNTDRFAQEVWLDENKRRYLLMGSQDIPVSQWQDTSNS